MLHLQLKTIILQIMDPILTIQAHKNYSNYRITKP